MKSDEDLYNEAYQAELEKIRAREIQDQARIDAREYARRNQGTVQRKTGISGRLQKIKLKLAGGNILYLEMTSKQISEKLAELAAKAMQLNEEVKHAEKRFLESKREILKSRAEADRKNPPDRLTLDMRVWQGPIEPSDDDLRPLRELRFVNQEFRALLRELDLRTKIKSY